MDPIDIYNLRDCFSIFPVGMPDDADDDDENEDPDDDGANSDGEGGDGGAGSNGTDTAEAKLRSEEAKKYRLERNEARKALEAAQAKVKEFEDKNKSETQRASDNEKAAMARAEKAEAALTIQARKLAFYDSGAAALFRNPASALRLLDLDDLELDDDGEFDEAEVKKRADALLKAEPYLGVVSDDAGDPSKGKGTPKTPTPGQKNGSGKPTQADALAKKYPALRGR